MDCGAVHTRVDVLGNGVLVDDILNLYRTGLAGTLCVLYHPPRENDCGHEPLSDSCSQSQKETYLPDIIKWLVRCCG